MERGVLDTSVLIADDLAPIPGRLAISVVSMAELQFGILVAKSSDARAQRLARVNALQRRFDPLPVDDAVAESYGRLAARVVEIGRQPRGRSLDLMIAATAHAHEACLYTRNPDDFRGLEDLVEVISL
ncbi:type II toxin-antitoxin system VapC family toxin [Kineosporia rhizophila]|uniref:type II toxin-antitoxin system VapC family toxin n=1 Tax=Kineosporia TaxID=49184 RepID=UPI000A772A29|nr:MULTISPECIES: type II toxin-antitoxin system VapC family toxin [Kineosporia]MCE0540454.1 type II toxin-antitoxin system VapC family toxin [Kineosporia rhizophila]GLY20127.1 ribonuclease VapC5 [Kineosporia sp. NBRC 101677]